MENPKEALPLSAWKQLESFTILNHKLFYREEKENCLIHFKAKKYSFFFSILKYTPNQGVNTFDVQWNPLNSNSTNSGTYNLKIDGLKEIFSKWIELIKGYDSVITVFDEDPIIIERSKELYEKFELIEEDDKKGLSILGIESLSNYLDHCSKVVNENTRSDNIQLAERIQEEISTAKKSLLSDSKDSYAKKQSKIWALMMGLGRKAFEDAASSMLRECVWTIVKWTYNSEIDLTNFIKMIPKV